MPFNPSSYQYVHALRDDTLENIDDTFYREVYPDLFGYIERQEREAQNRYDSAWSKAYSEDGTHEECVENANALSQHLANEASFWWDMMLPFFDPVPYALWNGDISCSQDTLLSTCYQVLMLTLDVQPYTSEHESLLFWVSMTAENMTNHRFSGYEYPWREGPKLSAVRIRLPEGKPPYLVVRCETHKRRMVETLLTPVLENIRRDVLLPVGWQ